MRRLNTDEDGDGAKKETTNADEDEVRSSAFGDSEKKILLVQSQSHSRYFELSVSALKYPKCAYLGS